MKCLTELKLIKYMSGDLNSVEKSQIRDHLITCKSCSELYESFISIENNLKKPIMIEPPAGIENSVMKFINKGYSYIGSIISLIFVSFLLLITGIYIYFDFANDSIIKALRITSKKTSTFISGFINFIESVVAGITTVFSAINSLIEAALNIRLGVELTGMIISSLFIFSMYLVFRKIRSIVKSS